MEFDVVAEKLFQRMVSGHRDLVAARALGRQDGFIGTTKQIRAVIAPWRAAATPMLTVPDQRGGGHQRSAAATAPSDGASVTTVFVTAVNHHRILAVFAQRKGRVVTGEGDNGKGIRIPDIGPRRPLRGQHRGPDVVVAVAQEAVVQVEVLDELCEDLFADLAGGCRGRFQQLVGDGSDQDQIARHRVLRFGHDADPGRRACWCH